MVICPKSLKVSAMVTIKKVHFTSHEIVYCGGKAWYLKAGDYGSISPYRVVNCFLVFFSSCACGFGRSGPRVEFFSLLRMWVWSEWAESGAHGGLDWWLEWAMIGPDARAGWFGPVAELSPVSEWALSEEVVNQTVGLT
jgi:hypothetical protein